MEYPDGEEALKKRSVLLSVPPEEKWGPYVSERGWGTVREDYSPNGDPWNYFTHDHARSRAYRRSEDGIAGISDRFQVLLFAPAFWNGKDPILKERLFGLNAFEGNHGEDVKELYYYLDAMPDHRYLKYLYKYPQNPFPYDELVLENQKRGVCDREFEILDTKAFDEDRYFDIWIEYAKVDDEDLCIRIEAVNQGKEPADLHILPQLWFRNQWSWEKETIPQPVITSGKNGLIADDSRMPPLKNLLFDYHLGRRYLYGPPGASLLFTNNETNQEKLFNRPNATPFVKDAFHRFLIEKETNAVNPDPFGTKAALHYFFPGILPKKRICLKLRLTPKELKNPLDEVDATFSKRKKETDQFFASIHPSRASEEERAIQRQALSGLVWNKQIYIYDVGNWLEGDAVNPSSQKRKAIRNSHWRHIASLRLFLMPDKWEFPWFASWDLSFQAVAYALLDLDFAKQQVWLLLFDQFQHPNGALPAYEWEFSDVNPPVQAWAVLKIFEYEKEKFGREDFHFLEQCFHKLLLNFSWWINKVDSLGKNIFEGGFLGMDNIGMMDRSEKLPEGFCIDQADGSGWISLLCLNLMRISLILSKRNPIYEGLGIKFFHHFLFVTAAMRKGYWRKYDMWDEKDSFFYSFVRHPDGHVDKVRIRSLVGIIPFFACDVWDEEELKQYSQFYPAYRWLMEKRQNLTDVCVQHIPHVAGCQHVFGLLDAKEMQRFLSVLWNPEEFRSDYGLRSLSKYHEKHPCSLHECSLAYEPGEAFEKIKGGNSNWRGPIWMPLNFLFIDTLLRLSIGFKDTLKVQWNHEDPVTLKEMAHSFGERLLSLFKKNEHGNRPIYGDYERLQKDPQFQDLFLFYEHFHGDTGRGLGASHQTGWTALIANLISSMREG